MRLLIGSVLLLTACSASATGVSAPRSADTTGGGAVAATSVPSRALIIATAFEPESLEASFGRGAGNRDFGSLVSGSLAFVDYPHKPIPYLAAQLPSLEAGTWTVEPDGRMTTRYTLRPNLTFHDGHPLTAEDFAFAFEVRSTIPSPGAEAERYIATVQVIDDQTLDIAWKRPYIWAGEVNPPSFTPMPRHLLDEPFQAAVASGDTIAFLNSSLWREDFVGSGPYRIERWDPGIEVDFRSFDGFALGKPAVDQLKVRFIKDANVVVSNLLSGSIDLAYNPTIGYTQGETLLESDWPGKVDFFLGTTPRYLHFQMRTWPNTQLAVHDVRVRQALIHAVDRQSIVDGIYSGRTVPLDVWLHPSDQFFQAVERAISKYPFDMARAQALLDQAGWQRAGDGTLRNAAGEALSMPILAHSGRIEEAETEVIASAWRTLGMSADVSWLTPEQMRDGEFRSKFPAVTYDRRGLQMVWTSDQVAGPDNRWALGNRNGYANPEFDDRWSKYVASASLPDRERYLVEAMKILTADAAVMPTHLQPRIVARPASLTGIKEMADINNNMSNTWEWRWE